MKKFFLFLITCIIFFSCSSKWEYKIISIKGQDNSTYSKYLSKNFDITDSLLNQYGLEGWELVDVYEKIETVHPNYGNDEYVTGLQPNVRTSDINFIFKKKIYPKK